MPHRLTLRPNGKIRAQRSKDYSMAINGLMTRRSFLISEAPETLDIDLEAIDHSLQLLGFLEDPQAFMPCRKNKRIFVKGEMLRLIRGVLREAKEPMTSREICLEILPPDFDLSDKKRVNEATSRVYKTLVRECEAGRVCARKSSKPNDVLPASWELQHGVSHAFC